MKDCTRACVALVLLKFCYKHTWIILISKHGVLSSRVALGIKTHAPNQNRDHLFAVDFMNH